MFGVLILIIIVLVVALVAMFFRNADILRELEYLETTKTVAADHLNDEISRLKKKLKETE